MQIRVGEVAQQYWSSGLHVISSTLSSWSQMTPAKQ